MGWQQPVRITTGQGSVLDINLLIAGSWGGGGQRAWVAAESSKGTWKTGSGYVLTHEKMLQCVQNWEGYIRRPFRRPSALRKLKGDCNY